MNRRAELSRLQDLASLMLDHRLAQLKKAADAKSQSEAALAALAAPSPAAEGDLEGMSAALAGLAYQRWADTRRAEINIVLAQQTHVWLEQRAAAQAAFGKADALRRLAENRKNKP